MSRRVEITIAALVLALATMIIVRADEKSSDPPAVCRLRVFNTGVCQIGKDHVFGSPHTADERMPFVIYAFLVEGPGGQKALVDLGPKTVDYCNRMFRRHGLFRDRGAAFRGKERYPDDLVQPHGNVLRWLERVGVKKSAIGHIVFSHLHADHHGMDDATDGGIAEELPEAFLWVSAVGWKDNLAKRRDGQWGSYVDYAFADFLVRREKEGKTRFVDDSEVFPGLRTMRLGGHSVCSQAAIVSTRQGLVIIASDDVYHYDLLAKDILPHVRTSRRQYREALDRLVDLAVEKDAVIVPMHDPIVWTAHKKAGDRWIDALRPHSRRAVRGYVEAREARRKREKAQKESGRSE